MTNLNTDLWKKDAIIVHSQRLFDSFKHWTGETLIDANESPEDIAQALFNADFVLVSAGTEDNPIFNYGNRTALDLWEMSWEQFIQTPSSHSVHPEEVIQRQQTLDRVKTQGYTKNLRGFRQSRTGKQFLISDVTVWNVIDENGQYCGQAATYETWEFL